MILFFLESILTNIIFSLIICAVLVRLNKRNAHSNLELLLYSLGLGPVFTSLLLYYFLLFSPHQSYLFYLLSVFAVYLILLLWGRKSYSILWAEIKGNAKKAKGNFIKLNNRSQIEVIVFSLIIVFFLASFLFLYFTKTLQTPLDGTDALNYGMLGKILFNEKSLEYRWIRFYPKTGYYLLANNHPPSFSLLLTWEKIMDVFFNADKDLYYKSIGAYYALLIMGIMFFWLSKKNKYLALLGIFALLSGFSFYQALITQHLDTYRIYFLAISWIFLALAIEKNDFLSFLLLGIFSGFAAFSHSIGGVLTCFNVLAILIFIKGNLKIKLKKTAFVTLLIIIFGWFHYILDIFWGFGWIFFKRDITFWG